MPERLEFPKLITVTPYPRPGFPSDSPTLCADTVQSFSLVTGVGDIVATLGMWYTSDMGYARLWDMHNNPSYEVGISKEILRVDKSALEHAVTDMLLRCGMRLFTLQDEIAATSSAIASLVS